MIYYNCTYIFFLQYHTIIRANLYVCPLQLLNPIFNVFTLNHLECNSFNGEKTCRTIHVFHFAFCWGGGVLLLHRTSTIPASVNMPDMLSDVWRWRGRSQVSQAYVFISVKLSPGKSKLTQVLILFDLFFLVSFSHPKSWPIPNLDSMKVTPQQLCDEGRDRRLRCGGMLCNTAASLLHVKESRVGDGVH